jgi:hypothetical protein
MEFIKEKNVPTKTPPIPPANLESDDEIIVVRKKPKRQPKKIIYESDEDDDEDDEIIIRPRKITKRPSSTLPVAVSAPPQSQPPSFKLKFI